MQKTKHLLTKTNIFFVFLKHRRFSKGMMKLTASRSNLSTTIKWIISMFKFGANIHWWLMTSKIQMTSEQNALCCIHSIRFWINIKVAKSMCFIYNSCCYFCCTLTCVSVRCRINLAPIINYYMRCCALKSIWGHFSCQNE